MIELRDISVRYESGAGSVRAVEDVSLRIADAEIYGIVGTSGAGKSSVLRTINLLQHPSSGQVLIDGRDITGLGGVELRRERQKIGMVFQHFNLLHTSTVYDNAAFALRAAGSPKKEIERRVPEVLELVGLSDKARAYPAQLSGGQKQRVGIARAIANHPSVLLCDEPTSALDLETTASILDLLREVNRRLGITIVIISHEMEVIKAICTRVAVMDAGRVVEEGDVFEIFANPRHTATRQLVEHTQKLDLPDRLVENLKGALLKITYLGPRAETPVLSEATRRFGVAVNILHGKIEYINDQPLGLLVAQITGDDTGNDSQVAEAVRFIKESTAHVEVLHG